jgi:hypothetical protein
MVSVKSHHTPHSGGADGVSIVTVVVNVGDPLVFTWAAPATGPTPNGYNLISGPTPSALAATAAANLAGPNFLSLGLVFTYKTVATPAMVGFTYYALNDWTCDATGCNLSVLTPTLIVQVNAPQVALQPAANFNVRKGP